MVSNFIKNRFTTKVVVVILLVSLIPTIINSVFYYVSSSRVVKENVRESSLQIVRQTADSLSFIFTIGSDMSDLIYSNNQLQNLVKKDIEGNLTSLERDENNDFITFLNSNIYSSSFVRSIYILKEEGKSWGSGTFSEFRLAQYKLQELHWAKEAIQKDGELYWDGLQYDRFSGAGDNTELVLPISRVMKDFDDLSNIAYIQVFLDGREILNRVNQVKLGKTGRVFVVDEKGKVVIDPHTENINKAITNSSLPEYISKNDKIEFEFNDSGVNYYGIKQPLSNGWTVVGVVPIHEITDELSYIQYISVLTSILLGVLVIVIGYIVAKRVTKPIKTLTNQMKLVGEGNFKVKTIVETTDEIGTMSNQFNEMIQQVDGLMQQVKKEQVQTKEAELRAVKHRINPHFLFNTLSTIRWLVQLKQFNKANSALIALSRLLEVNMGKKGTFVTVREEIDFIEKFIEILQIRYDKSFHLKAEIEDNMETYPIPQMILQPIVENSIFHGIVPGNKKEGTIHISATKFLDGIEIVISDNGIGISKERLKELQVAVKQLNKISNTAVGIGLLHVVDSKNLYFHPESTMEIESSEDGTTVKLILIPKKTRGGNHV